MTPLKDHEPRFLEEDLAEAFKRGRASMREEAARVCEAQYESVNRFERSVIAAAIRALPE